MTPRAQTRLSGGQANSFARPAAVNGPFPKVRTLVFRCFWGVILHSASLFSVAGRALATMGRFRRSSPFFWHPGCRSGMVFGMTWVFGVIADMVFAYYDAGYKILCNIEMVSQLQDRHFVAQRLSLFRDFAGWRRLRFDLWRISVLTVQQRKRVRMMK
ncbi:hypothetical protein BDV96DRAFT_102649 [Lophiotrema nucula]|uniref:Uncharacterized protein n=1 Tax=Lophiotrema nucula TaxID=690887 RepID=A0A6A5Z695_9PLEO|nr:hypothetical protein BDV96DRAFT_102649 [Lophiotrema nucula]